MKYIVLKHEDESEYMILFPNCVKMTHKNMVEAVQSVRVDHGFKGWEREFRTSEVVSAGFVDSSGFCHGRSESLGLRSREEDTALLKRQYR